MKKNFVGEKYNSTFFLLNLHTVNHEIADSSDWFCIMRLFPPGLQNHRLDLSHFLPEQERLLLSDK